MFHRCHLTVFQLLLVNQWCFCSCTHSFLGDVAWEKENSLTVSKTFQWLLALHCFIGLRSENILQIGEHVASGVTDSKYSLSFNCNCHSKISRGDP